MAPTTCPGPHENLPTASTLGAFHDPSIIARTIEVSQQHYGWGNNVRLLWKHEVRVFKVLQTLDKLGLSWPAGTAPSPHTARLEQAATCYKASPQHARSFVSCGLWVVLMHGLAGSASVHTYHTLD
jgi:hypothetical protein